MNTPNVHAGRLERRVRRVGRETMPVIHRFCSLFPFGAICGAQLLRLTAFLFLIIFYKSPILFHVLYKCHLHLRCPCLNNHISTLLFLP